MTTQYEMGHVDYEILCGTSKDKPYRILEASFDGKLWYEVSRTYSEGEVQWTDPGKFHSVRIRHVGADGKTEKTVVTKTEMNEPVKPRPKADTTPDPWDELSMPPASQRQVKELCREVRALAQLLQERWRGFTNLIALEALLDRLDGDKG